MRLDRNRVPAVEGRQEAFEVPHALRWREEWLEIRIYGIVRQCAGTLVRRSERGRRAIERLVRVHLLQGARKTTCFRHGQKRLERLGWPVVVRVAVGQRETSNAGRVQRREDQRDAAAAVIPDEIHTLYPQGVDELHQHFGVCRRRHVLCRCDLCVPMRQQVDRDTPPHVTEVRELVPPEMAVHQHAMNEERDGTGALFDVADASRRCCDAVALHGELLWVHTVLCQRGVIHRVAPSA